jgi:hypothetical protein
MSVDSVNLDRLEEYKFWSIEEVRRLVGTTHARRPINMPREPQLFRACDDPTPGDTAVQCESLSLSEYRQDDMVWYKFVVDRSNDGGKLPQP